MHCLSGLHAGVLPMGSSGFLLPLLVYGMTMTSLRLGVGASGLRMAQGLKEADDRVRE